MFHSFMSVGLLTADTVQTAYTTELYYLIVVQNAISVPVYYRCTSIIILFNLHYEIMPSEDQLRKYSSQPQILLGFFEKLK